MPTKMYDDERVPDDKFNALRLPNSYVSAVSKKNYTLSWFELHSFQKFFLKNPFVFMSLTGSSRSCNELGFSSYRPPVRLRRQTPGARRQSNCPETLQPTSLRGQTPPGQEK